MDEPADRDLALVRSALAGDPDNPNTVNVIFTYNGPTVTTDTVFGTASVVSTFSETSTGVFSSETARNSGSLAGTPLGHIGLTTVPTPEPSSVVMMGLGGLVAVGLAVRRRRRTAPARPV